MRMDWPAMTSTELRTRSHGPSGECPLGIAEPRRPWRHHQTASPFGL